MTFFNLELKFIFIWDVFPCCEENLAFCRIRNRKTEFSIFLQLFQTPPHTHIDTLLELSEDLCSILNINNSTLLQHIFCRASKIALEKGNRLFHPSLSLQRAIFEAATIYEMAPRSLGMLRGRTACFLSPTQALELQRSTKGKWVIGDRDGRIEEENIDWEKPVRTWRDEKLPVIGWIYPNVVLVTMGTCNFETGS